MFNTYIDQLYYSATNDTRASRRGLLGRPPKDQEDCQTTADTNSATTHRCQQVLIVSFLSEYGPICQT